MSAVRRCLGLASLALVAVWIPAGLAGQDEQQGQKPPKTLKDTTELVFEREVFNYPSYQRTNPFQPAIEGEEAGPRFADLVLIGIIESSNPALSVALLADGISYDENGRLTIEQGAGGVQVGGRAGAPQDSMPPDSTGQGQAQDIASAGYQTYRVRQGDQLGNMRILEIQRMRVIVEVEEFGDVERREFVLRTPANRGGQP